MSATLWEDDYLRFKAAYPVARRVGGDLARKAFLKAMASGVSVEQMIAAVEQHKRSEQWAVRQMVPLLTTWLNQFRWEQVLPEPRHKIGYRPERDDNAPL